MFVAEEAYLGKGYATLALQKFLIEYIKGKFLIVVVDPLKTNRNAIQFFERNGFKKFTNNQSESNHERLVLYVT